MLDWTPNAMWIVVLSNQTIIYPQYEVCEAEGMQDIKCHMFHN